MRLCKADIHGVMDQLEDKGLLLKQYMRDMEEELGRKEASLRQMVVSRDKAQQDLGREIREFHEQVEEQRLQYEQLQLRAKEYSHQAEREQWEKAISTTVPAAASREPNEEEVELELLKRKEAAKGGAEK
jgi:phage shock protein A